MQEIWKIIDEYPDYEVSDLGRVRRAVAANYPAGRELKPDRQKAGYLRVTLCSGGQAKRFLVHRLVAYAFVDGWMEGMHVSHLDGDPANNSASNLAWQTPSQNNQMKDFHGTSQRGERGGRAILTENDVRSIIDLRRNLHGQRKHWGATRISRELGLPERAVKHVIAGTSWKHIKRGIV